MKAKTISVTYEPGEYNLTQGHKGYEKKRYKNNRYINRQGLAGRQNISHQGLS